MVEYFRLGLILGGWSRFRRLLRMKLGQLGCDSALLGPLFTNATVRSKSRQAYRDIFSISLGKHRTESLSFLNHHCLACGYIEGLAITIVKHHSSLEHADPFIVVESQPWFRCRCGDLHVCNANPVL
jgi:hypothetical protein